MYTTISLADDEPLQKPDVSTIFGSVYVQGQTVGLASYHFYTEQECYINYAAAPERWVLDDGSRLPARKAFTQHRFDAATRTFRGYIDWYVCVVCMGFLGMGACVCTEVYATLSDDVYPRVLVYVRRIRKCRIKCVIKCVA